MIHKSAPFSRMLTKLTQINIASSKLRKINNTREFLQFKIIMSIECMLYPFLVFKSILLNFIFVLSLA